MTGKVMLKIMRDNQVLGTVENENQALEWLLKHQGNSVYFALKFNGYKVVDQDGKTLMQSYITKTKKGQQNGT